MISVVRCSNKMCVQLPKNVICKIGDTIPCPKNCTCFKKVDSFSVVSVWQMDEKKAGSAAKYSDEEIISYWGQEIASSVSSTNSDTQGSNVDNSSPNIDFVVERHDNSHVISEPSENTGEILRPKSFGRSQRSQHNSVPEADAILRSQESYEQFIISGKVFTDDVKLRASVPSQPLRNALWEVFSYWETRSVFKTETELRDEFIWLITSSSKRTFKKSEIDAILLNEEYGLSEKFFYLFYDIIYRYEPPKGFYWCDKVLSRDPLSSFFRDKKDFVVKYCNAHAQGEQFRLFYMAHKKEILHFLGSDNEEKLFEDMTLSLAKDVGEIVLIDKYNNYMPINMGKISSFIINMQQPTELTNMRNMVYFLEKYRVTRLGVVPRTVEYPFEKSVRGELLEDVSMYATLRLNSSASYASEYDCFITLLHEYVKVFNPGIIKIGALTFTKSNFSNELEEIVKNLCKSYFGKVTEDVFADYKSCAWLAKSIYDRNILSTYILENKSYVDKFMQLISNPTLEQYFSIFDDCVIQLHYRDLSIHEYIADLMQVDVYTVCGEFREDNIIREYFSYKIKNWSKTDLNELFNKYQQQYEAFINS